MSVSYTVKRIDPAPPIDSTEQFSIRTRDIFEFMNADFPPREHMLAPWLPVQGLAMCYAPRGGCKTHLAGGVAWAVATGGKFWRWEATKARRVLLLDGEMPRTVLQERFKMISSNSPHQPPSWDNLTIAAADDQDLARPRAGSTRLHARQPEHFAPLLGFLGDEPADICGLARKADAAVVRVP